MDRLRPALDAITSIENYWCHTAARDVVGKNGGLDLLTKHVNDAWEEVGKRNESKHVRKAKPLRYLPKGSVKEGESGAIDEMVTELRRRWKPMKRPQGR